MILTSSSSRNCKMTFIVGRGFAERQILKKWKWHYLLNWVKYFDKLLRKHWYWQDLAIAKWHFSHIEALPSSKFYKSDYGTISLTEWNIMMKLCIRIDMSFEIGWVFAKVQILKKVRLLQMTFIIGRGFPERQIRKKWKWPYLMIWVEYFDRLLLIFLFCVNIILSRSSPRDCEMSFFIGRGFAELQILKKLKWPYLLNRVEYCDEILHTHWYIDKL